MSTVIQPTVGRVVWFFRDVNQQEPLAALVAKVWAPNMVNLSVVTEDGGQAPYTSVPLIQEGESRPPHGCFCTWMPFQVGQARAQTAAIPKTE